MNPYLQGNLAALQLKPGTRRLLLDQSLSLRLPRFTSPDILKRFLAGVRDSAIDAEIVNPSPSTLEDQKINQPQENKNMNINEVLVALIAALNNIADATRGSAAPTNITNIAAAPNPATVAAPANKPAGNTASLEKARAAAAAKKKAADEAAAAQADLDLMGGETGTSGVTLEMLRGKGMEILKAKKQPEMKSLVESLGATSLTTLSEDKYQEAYDGLEAILSL